LVTKRNMLFSGSLKKIKVCRLKSNCTVLEREHFRSKC